MTFKNFLKNSIDALADPDTAHLERPVAQSSYTVPTGLIMKDGKIYLSEVGRNHVVKPSYKILEDFVQLAYASDKKILHYASKWGLLDLCEEHLMPASHDSYCKPIIPSRQVSIFVKEESAQKYRKELLSKGEPLKIWRYYARFAQAIIGIAANHQEEKLGNNFDWARLHSDRYGFLGSELMNNEDKDISSFTDKLMFEKKLICYGVNIWLNQGNVRPILQYIEGKPVIVFECDNPYGKLFANLAIQLMMVATQTSGVAFCSACNKSYIPKRRPREGERHYCPECGKRAAWRDAQADKRKRVKGS